MALEAMQRGSSLIIRSKENNMSTNECMWVNVLVGVYRCFLLTASFSQWNRKPRTLSKREVEGRGVGCLKREENV